MQYAWTCHCCGKQFDTLPLDFGFDAPVYWYQLQEDERKSRAVLSPDFCSIDDEDFFVRGCLEVPVIGLDDKFVWGVWASLSKESMARAKEIWDQAVIENEPSRFGWLSNSIKIYPPTLNLKTAVHFRGGDLRPLIELEATDHPLAIEQRDGITLERVQDIVAAFLPHHDSGGTVSA